MSQHVLTDLVNGSLLQNLLVSVCFQCQFSLYTVWSFSISQNVFRMLQQQTGALHLLWQHMYITKLYIKYL